MNKRKLYTWKECNDLSIKDVFDLYASYVNEGQVKLISSFGFGRELADYAKGISIFTKEGKEIYDFTGGVGVLSHGHNHPRILEARIEFQKQSRMEVHKNFLSQYIAGLSHNIATLLPEDLDISYFCNSGAESVEGAVKLAYKYHGGKRSNIMVANIGFHGKLLGTGGLTRSPELHFEFPTISNVSEFKYNDINSVTSVLESLKKPNGESDVYALLIEPMNASSLRKCTHEFLEQLRKLCSDNDIILIFDEVYTGWCKTGELFHFMESGVCPDIVTMAKSFGGGKSSISAFVSRKPVFEKAYGNLNDAIMHSTTYNGFGEETITAIEAINIMIEEDFSSRSKEIYNYLNPKLQTLQEKYPDIIKEVRGSGSLNGIILNDHKNLMIRTALKFIPGALFNDPRFYAKLVTSAVISELYNEYKVLCFYGSNQEIPLIISPSIIASNHQLDYFVDSLDKVLSKGLKSLVVKFAKYKFLDPK